VTQQVELVFPVDDDDRARAISGLQVLDALVVAEEVHAVARKAGLQRKVQLARRNDVEAETFLCDDAQELRRGERLGGVEDLSRAVHRGHVFRGALPYRRFVVDVKRGAMAAGDFNEVAATHLHVAGGVDPVRDREEQG